MQSLEAVKRPKRSLGELDAIDRHILNRLQEDARVSFKKIAKEINVSEATVFVRVKKLQQRGIIKGFRAIVDSMKVGKGTTAIVLVKAEPKAFPKMLDALGKLDDVYEIYDVTGSYYSVLKIRTRSNEEVGKIIDEIGMIDGVAGTETVIALRTIKEQTAIKL